MKHDDEYKLKARKRGQKMWIQVRFICNNVVLESTLIMGEEVAAMTHVILATEGPEYKVVKKTYNMGVTEIILEEVVA